MANGHNKPSENLPEKCVEGNDVESDEDITTGEVASLCATMDQLDSCLDDIERKNDSLNAKLKDLLQSMEDDKDGDQDNEEDQERAQDQASESATGDIPDTDKQ